MADILVIFHSVGGHTFRMAEAIAEGVCSLSGCEANLKQITEPPGADAILLPKVDNRKSDFSDIPVAQVKDLEDCDLDAPSRPCQTARIFAGEASDGVCGGWWRTRQ